MLQSALLRAFRPTTALMGRLTYPQKFALIGCVLLAPLAFVAYTYFGLQGTNKAFSAKERVGVAYIAPLNALLGKVVSSEEAADAVAAVDAVAPLGAQLGTADEWTQARDEPTAAALEKLIVDAGNGSNLILDPDLDGFYLMDAVVNKLPLLVDTSGKLGSGEQGVKLAVDRGVLTSNVSALDAGFQTAFQSTADGTLKSDLAPKIAAFNAAAKAVGSAPGPAHAAAAVAAGTELAAAVSPRLDQLIEVRIGKVVAKEHRVEWVAALAVLLALYLFVGFYLAVRKGLTAMRSDRRHLPRGPRPAARRRQPR